MERNTPRRDGNYTTVAVKGGTKIEAGTLVAINANGFAVPATDTAGLRVIGRAEFTADNKGGDGDAFVTAYRKDVKYENSATKPLTAAHIGTPAYVENSVTVASDSEEKIPAGIVVEVEADGIWINPEAAPLC